MEKMEFNLSVLENVPLFNSPLKSLADYETILALINKEIYTNTDDETESQRTEKLPYPKSRRRDSELDYRKDPFKSPHNRKFSLRVKSPGKLLKKPHNQSWQETENPKNEHDLRRARSLGLLKSGRSCRQNYRKNRSSVLHLFNNSDTLDFEANNSVKTADITVSNGDASGGQTEEKVQINEKISQINEERVQINKENVGANTDDESTEEPSSAVLSSLTPPLGSSSPMQSQCSDFVESSQSATSSNLRKKLLNRRSTLENKSVVITDSIKEIGRTDSPESEEETHNICLSFSPDPESRRSSVSRDLSLTPTRPEKRKANVVCPIVESNSKQRKLEGPTENNLELHKTEENISFGASPLEGLSRELENCIGNGDYEQSSGDLQTDILERTSFTFETIELLDQYEGPDQRKNNQILSKIFSSPPAIIKEESLDSLNSVNLEEQLTEDRLQVDENAANIAEFESEGNNRSDVAAQENKGKQSVRKSVESKKLPDLNFSIQEMENIDPLTSEKEKSVETSVKEKTGKSNRVKTLRASTRHSSRISLGEKINVSENMAAPESEENSDTENFRNAKTRKSLRTEKSIGVNKRRSSSQSKRKQPDKDLSELEDDRDLAEEAAEIAEKIEAAKKKAALSEKTLQKLDELVIRLRHEVPPQHEIENRAGSKCLSYKQQKKFMEFAPLNKRTYSPAEDAIIQENWKAFCEDHNWSSRDYKPFLSLKHGRTLIMSSLEERRKFVQYLAQGLPTRPLCSVYSRFKTIYGKHPTAGSRYTREEDAQILAYMLHKPATHPDKKCSELAKVLDRTRESIWKRYKKLAQRYCHKNERKVSKKVEWNLALVEDFIATLLDVTLSEDIMELKDALIPKVVWLQMEKKMGIDNQLMKRFWDQQLHLQLFAAEPLYLNRIKITLIERMYEKKIWHPADIQWQQIVGDFEGLTTSFLRKVFNHLTSKTALKLHSRNLKNILNWLYTKEIDQLLHQPKEKCLPRISYKDKKAEIVKEDAEKIETYWKSLEVD